MSALLIVGHGTRDETGAAEFRRFVARVADRARDSGAADAVAGGFIELSPPPLRDAVAGLVDAGHRDLTAVPLILLAAGHAKGDIPAALARERERHAGLGTTYARPLGPHPVILELLRQRLAQCVERQGAAEQGAASPSAASRGIPNQGAVTRSAALQGAANQPVPKQDASAPDADSPLDRPDAVLLVGRGTTDPDANADLYRAARLLWETTREAGIRQVEAAFVSLAQPSVAQGLDRLAALGARRVVVLPFFLFPGVLPTRIHDQTRAWRAERDDGFSATETAAPRIDATVADVIGDCDELAGLVLERYAEASGRSAAPAGMNCDACVYRIAMPGFESRVGQEQRPHDHPDDPAHPHGHPHESSSHAGSAHPSSAPHTHGHTHQNGHGHASHSGEVHSVPESRISVRTGPASDAMG